MPSEPTDPFNVMAAGAVGLHETMSSYIEAGFTPDQAFALIGFMVQTAASVSMTHQLNNQPPDG
jgi:hypothetical protein